jgi:hypothetical protein
MANQVDLYNSTYGNFQAQVLAEIRRETYGEDIGQSAGSPLMNMILSTAGLTSPQVIISLKSPVAQVARPSIWQRNSSVVLQGWISTRRG